MMWIMLLAALALCCPTVYHLLQLQKLNREIEDWGFLTEEEKKRKRHHTSWSLFWGIFYVFALFATVIAGADY